MIVATPLKSVMTLEPFIGGACFVDIAARNRSATLQISYDQQRRRLDLPEPAKEAVPEGDGRGTGAGATGAGGPAPAVTDPEAAMTRVGDARAATA